MIDGRYWISEQAGQTEIVKITPYYLNVADGVVLYRRQIFVENKRLQLGWSTFTSPMQPFDKRDLRRILIIRHAFADCQGYQIIFIERIGISVLCHPEDWTEPIFDTRDAEEEFAGAVFVKRRIRLMHEGPVALYAVPRLRQLRCGLTDQYVVGRWGRTGADAE